ncbi:MAG: alpha/beta hydrolase [Pseudomonadales bacterium]|nr:alpha/beta hydrolase [Pseudomonadales bacterium]
MRSTMHAGMIKLMAFALLLMNTATAEVSIKADVVYGHKDGMALVYDVLQPEQANGAAIVYMVSGGWVSRWAEPENRVRQFSDMLDAGFTVIPVHHGSSPRYFVPEAYADVSRAIRHIRLHADAHGIDPDRIGVTGGSAGGHLSLMLGLNADNGDSTAADPVLQTGNQVATVVAYYPPVDLRSMTGPSDRFPALNFPNEQAASISPLLHVDPQDPPVLLIHGDADDLVNISHSQNMFAELQTKGIESNFITLPGAGHGFRGEDARKAAAARLAWFEKHLK